MDPASLLAPVSHWLKPCRQATVIFPERLCVHLALRAFGLIAYVHSVKEKRPGKNCGHRTHGCLFSLTYSLGHFWNLSVSWVQDSPSRVLGQLLLSQEGSRCACLCPAQSLCALRGLCALNCAHTPLATPGVCNMDPFLVPQHYTLG